MPRSLRASAGGFTYHVYNTAAPRRKLFRADVDYANFVTAVRSAAEALGTVVLGYCLMPDHFHLVLLPRRDGDLSRFMLRVVAAHVRQYRIRYRADKGDKLYASRFRSFPVQKDEHVLDVLRFVESNALRVGIVNRVGNWSWSSLPLRAKKDPLLQESPVKIPAGWEKSVTNIDEKVTEAIRTCLLRGRPYGDDAWSRRTADKLGIASSLRPIGRPRKIARSKKKSGSF